MAEKAESNNEETWEVSERLRIFLDKRASNQRSKWLFQLDPDTMWTMTHSDYFTPEEQNYMLATLEASSLESVRQQLGLSKRRIWDLQRIVHWKWIELHCATLHGATGGHKKKTLTTPPRRVILKLRSREENS